MTRPGVILLAVRESKRELQLVGTFSDEQEIQVFEEAVTQGELNPLKAVAEWRTQKDQEDSEFGDYVEDLVSQPFVTPEVKQHGVQWLKSRIRIEQLQKSETEAAKVISEFAFKVFCDNPVCDDFFLMGKQSKVRVRVFQIKESLDQAA